jgi:altronate hydrolase
VPSDAKEDGLEGRYPLSYCISIQQTGFAAVGRGRSTEEWLSELARVGYDGVELAVRAPKEVDAVRLDDLLARYELTPVALGTGQAFLEEGLSLTSPERRVREGAIKRLREHLELASGCGIPLVVVGLIRGRRSGGQELRACHDLLVDGLCDLAPMAEGAGVRVALEPINRYETDLLATLEETAEVLDRVSSPAVGLLADTFHMNIEEADPLTELERWGKRTVHFHVADSNRWAPGHGHLDLPAWFRALERGGYEGFVSVECMDRPADAHREAMKTLRRLGLGRKGQGTRGERQGNASLTGEGALPVFFMRDADNVGVALRKLTIGEVVELAGHRVEVREEIPRLHKVALSRIRGGEPVMRYGEPIGRAGREIGPGVHVHTHNVSPIERAPTRPERTGAEVTAGSKREMGTPKSGRPHTFRGYVRPDGRVGTRNEIWIVSTVGCLAGMAEELASRGRRLVAESGIDGVRALTHPFGCSQLGDDGEATACVLASLARNPNGGGVLVLGLGCENTDPDELWESLRDIPEPRRRLVVAQRSGDCWGEARSALAELARAAGSDERTEVGLDKVCLGVKCGGSDALSGVTANPLVGRVADRIGKSGGRVLMGEVPEMLGAEHLLGRRAASDEIGEAFWEMVTSFRQELARFGAVSANPSPGNYEGGITTLAEKSLGCVLKAGRLPISDVVRYGERATAPGLTLVASPGNDLVSSTALVAAGANVLAFTTGRGTPMGSLVPTVKISSGSELAAARPGWIDFDGGAALPRADAARGGGEESRGADPTRRGRDELLELISRVCSGLPTAAERRGDCQMAIWKRGVTL